MTTRPVLAPPPDEPTPPAGVAPTFSVIVAAYQAAETIGEALSSVLAQTRPPEEIVVCDDGSTDELEAALAPYRDEIVLLHKENGGEASAKNAAARAASGDFVVILDADDAFAPERLEALAELAAARPDLDILTTDAYLEVDGRIARRCYDASWPFEVGDQRRGILERNFVFGLAAVRRERLLAVGGFDESILWTADWECWIRLVLSGSRVGLVDEPLARYRLREASLSAERASMVRGRLATLQKTAGDSRLTPREQAVLARSLAAQRRELLLADARASLAAGRPDARRRSLEAFREPGLGAGARLKSGASALAPGLARRLLARREARFWVGASGIRVERRRG